MSCDAAGVQPPPPRIASGRSAPASSVRSSSMSLGAGMRLHDGGTARASATSTPPASMSSGSASTTGPGPPGARGREGARDVLGDAVGAVDLRDPLRHRPEHAPVVDLLERLALLLVGGDLPDEQHRAASSPGTRCGRRPTACVAPGPRVTRQTPGPPGELAVGLGHVRGARLVAARDQADRRVVQPVEQREVALARDAEGDVGAVHGELVHEHLAAVTLTACARDRSARAAASASPRRQGRRT